MGDLKKVNYDEMYVRKTLEKILAGGFDPQTGEINPERNWSLVEELKAYVKDLIKDVKSKK